MENSYKIKEVKVTINSYTEITAEIENLENLKIFLEDLKKNELLNPSNDHDDKEDQSQSNNNGYGNPCEKIEVNAELPLNSLSNYKIIAFKDDVPQILKTTSFTKTSDALLVLLYSIQCGLNKKEISYDEFKSLYDGQNLKSGSPLSMMLTNLKNAKYINPVSYDKDRTISLTSKGDTKAIEILQSLVKK